MKNFLLGMVAGVLFVTTGLYGYLKDKVTDLFTKEKTEQVVQATQEYGKTMKKVFQED